VSLFSSDYLFDQSKAEANHSINMGIQTEIQDEIRKETVTKIHGQPTSHNLMILEKEIIATLVNIPHHWEEGTMATWE
jgi:hypothetical protein